jgi:hypothetical protein
MSAGCVAVVNTHSFRASKLAFSTPQKTNHGVIVDVTYDNAPLVLKTAPLRLAFDASIYYDKREIQLDVPRTEEHASLRRALQSVNERVVPFVRASAGAVFGRHGMDLKHKTPEDKCNELNDGTFKMYLALPPSENTAYGEKLKLKWNRYSEVAIVDVDNKPLTAYDLERGALVTAVFRVRSLFINEALLSLRLEAVALLVAGVKGADTAALFANEMRHTKARSAPRQRRDRESLTPLDM